MSNVWQIHRRQDSRSAGFHWQEPARLPSRLGCHFKRQNIVLRLISRGKMPESQPIHALDSVEETADIVEKLLALINNIVETAGTA